MAKTTSLFEVLPSSEGGTPVAEGKSEKSGRKVVPLTSEAAQPVLPKRDSPPENSVVGKSHSGDNFYVIASVFLIFVIITGLACFKLGRDYGFRVGCEYGVSQRSEREMRLVPSPQPQHRVAGSDGNESSASIRPVVRTSQPVTFPSDVQEMSKEQKQVLTPPAKRNRFTLQVEYLGRNHAKETGQLVEALKKKGFEAFGDGRQGMVYVGRFSSIKSAEARSCRKKIAGFAWKGYDFSDCYFVNIPKSQQ